MPEAISLGTRSRRRSLTAWAPLLGLTIVGFLVAWRFVEPAPPRRIRIASGSEGGAYYSYANRYRELLAPNGIELEVLRTAGSVQNIALLESGQVELAMVQGGTGGAARRGGLESLASLYFEPLWVFYRRARPVEYLTGFRGKRVSVGPDGSGAQMLAKQILADNGVTAETATLLPLEISTAVEQLKTGELDAAFFVSSPSAPAIRNLFNTPAVELMSMRQHLAYERKYRFLSTVTLGEGMIDLLRDLPSHDTALLAPAATLAARSDLHPALVPLILEVVTQVHEPGGMFEDANQFPSNRFTEFPVNDLARQYLRTGPSLLYRLFPFWAAVLIDRLKIMILPLITLLVPLVKLAPPLYRWRIRSKIYRWYDVIRDIDLKIEHGLSSPALRDERERLRTLEKEVNEVSVPASYMEEFYNLRMHIGLMLERLERQTQADKQHLEPGTARRGHSP